MLASRKDMQGTVRCGQSCVWPETLSLCFFLFLWCMAQLITVWFLIHAGSFCLLVLQVCLWSNNKNSSQVVTSNDFTVTWLFGQFRWSSCNKVALSLTDKSISSILVRCLSCRNLLKLRGGGDIIHHTKATLPVVVISGDQWWSVIALPAFFQRN